MRPLYDPAGKWSYAVLSEVARRPVGFEELRRALDGISPRVLSLRLKLMEGRGLVNRAVDVGRHPPSVRYSATPEGARVLKHFRALNGDVTPGVAVAVVP